MLQRFMKKKICFQSKNSKQSLMCRQIRSETRAKQRQMERFGYGTLLEDGRRYGPVKKEIKG